SDLCRAVVTNTQLALNSRDGGFARLDHKSNGFVIKRVIFIALTVAATHAAHVHFAVFNTLGNLVYVDRLTTGFPVSNHAVYFLIADKGAMNTTCKTTTRWQEQHVTVTQQLLCPALAQNRA